MADDDYSLDPRRASQGDSPDPAAPMEVSVRQVAATRVEVSWPPQADCVMFRVELLNPDQTPVTDPNAEPIFADVASTFVRFIVPFDGAVARSVRAKVTPIHPNGTVYTGTLSDSIAVTTQYDDSYIQSVSADKITTGSVNANLVLATGRIIAGNDPALGGGGYVEMKKSGIEWVPDGQTNPTIVIPSTGKANFSGVAITASNLDATNTKLRGGTTLEDDGVITASAGGVGTPTTEPTVASVWPTQMTLPAGTSQGIAYDSAGTRFWLATTSGARSYQTDGTADANLSFSAVGWSRSAVSGSWGSVARSESEDKWVAVGSVATASSSDGVTWTAQTTTRYWRRVIRSEADDLWVRMGYTDSAGIAYLALDTSSDGTTWSSRSVGTGATAGTIHGGAYSATEGWVFVTAEGYAYTSTNPATTGFTRRTINTSVGGFYDVARSDADDLWVAVGVGGAIYTSPDAITWTARTSGTTEALRSVARDEASDTWVAVGRNAILTSSDAITWTARTVPVSNLNLFDVTRAEGVWVIVGAGFLTSSDGINWTYARPYTGIMYGIDYSASEDKWIAVGSNYIYDSPDAGVGLGGASAASGSSITGVAVGTGDASTSRGFVLSGGTLARFNKSSGGILQSIDASTYTARAARPTIFYDDSKIKVVTQDASGTGGKVQLVAYTPSNLSTAPTTQTLDSGFTGSFSFYGAARFTSGGTDYYAIALSDGTRSGVYCFNASTGARASSLDFFDSQGNAPDGGIAYDATRFYTLATPTSTLLEKHSTFHPGAASQNTYIRYTYATTTDETQVSPAATLALAARAYLSVVVPDIPTAADKARVYIRGAASDATGANTYLKISTGDEDVTVYTYGDADYTTGLNINAGALGPWSGSSGAAAVIQSGSAGWELLGDGIIRLAEMTEPSAPAANKAVLFLKDNGSGKTQLCVRFSSGATQVIATQP